MKPLNERLACRHEQRFSKWVRELRSRRYCATERVPRCRRGLRRDPGRDGVCDMAAVDRGADHTQDRYAERPT